MQAKPKKITLFFTASSMPTEAESAAAEKLGTERFRNASFVDSGAIEHCDAVAGLVPEAYKVDGIEDLSEVSRPEVKHGKK